MWAIGTSCGKILVAIKDSPPVLLDSPNLGQEVQIGCSSVKFIDLYLVTSLEDGEIVIYEVPSLKVDIDKQKWRSFKIKDAELKELVPIVLNKSKFCCAISCGVNRNYVFKASFGMLRNHEKVVPVLAGSKGSLVQLEAVHDKNSMVLTTDHIAFFQLDLDNDQGILHTEFPLNDADGLSSFSPKFHVMQTVHSKASQAITVEFLLLSQGKLLQMFLLTEAEDSKVSYRFQSLRELKISTTPLTTFSLLSNSHLVALTTDGVLQGACFSLSASLQPNVFQPLWLSTLPTGKIVRGTRGNATNLRSSLLIARQVCFVLCRGVVLRVKALRDLEVAKETSKQGNLTSSLAIAHRWLSGLEGRLLSKESESLDTKKAGLSKKVVEWTLEGLRAKSTQLDEKNPAEELIGTLLDFCSQYNLLVSHFRIIREILAEKNKDEILFGQLLALLREGVITFLEDSLIIELVDYFSNSQLADLKVDQAY